jgi:hypothetical protein
MKYEIRNVLWATDFSREAADALAYADLFARKCGARISAVHIVPEMGPALLEARPAYMEEVYLQVVGTTRRRPRRSSPIWPARRGSRSPGHRRVGIPGQEDHRGRGQGEVRPHRDGQDGPVRPGEGPRRERRQRRPAPRPRPGPLRREEAPPPADPQDPRPHGFLSAEVERDFRLGAGAGRSARPDALHVLAPTITAARNLPEAVWTSWRD